MQTHIQIEDTDKIELLRGWWQSPHIGKAKQLEVVLSAQSPAYDSLQDALTLDACLQWLGPQRDCLNDALNADARIGVSATQLSSQHDGLGDALTADFRLAYGYDAASDSMISDTSMMNVSYDVAVRLCIIVVERACTAYYHSQRSHYRRLAMELDDVMGFVHERVTKKYLDMIKNRKAVYTVKSFRKSFYRSAHNACIGHYRMYIKSACRGTLSTRLVHLDDPNLSFALGSFSPPGAEIDAPILNQMTEDAPNDHVRTLLHFVLECGYAAKPLSGGRETPYQEKVKLAAQRKALIPEFFFEHRWSQMERHVAKWRGQLFAEGGMSAARSTATSYDSYDKDREVMVDEALIEEDLTHHDEDAERSAV